MNVTNLMTRPLTVSPTDSFDRAINLMEREDSHHLCVVDRERPVGLVSDRGILISTGWMLAIEPTETGDNKDQGLQPKRVEQIMTSPAHILYERNDARDAARLMMTHRNGAVPIQSEARLVGVVTDADLIRCLGDVSTEKNATSRFLKSPVRTLMTSPAITVSPDASLDDVVHVFKRFHIRHVPVTTDRMLRGIISDRDVRRALVWSTNAEFQKDRHDRLYVARTRHTAAEIMHKTVKSITGSATLNQALQLMRGSRIHSLPVVENGALIGIITQTDFVKVIAQELLI